MVVCQGSDLNCLTALGTRLGHCAHVATNDAGVGQVLLHPANLGTDTFVHLDLLQVQSGISPRNLLQLCGVTAAADFADHEFVHLVGDGPDERRLELSFPHRAALTVVLLELDNTKACAVDNDSLDAEGALISPAANIVKALWIPFLYLVFFPDTDIMPNDSGEQVVEVGASILAGLQDDFPTA